MNEETFVFDLQVKAANAAEIRKAFEAWQESAKGNAPNVPPPPPVPGKQ